MRIIISPAKKMREDTDSLAWRELPAFLDRTAELLARLQSMSNEELQKLWKCNDKIAALNVERLQRMDLCSRLTPAILAYEGIQYQYMAPGVFSEGEYDYIQTHLRILSGFYGVLRPFDGVAPYRLEMQAKLAVGGAKNIYDYWGAALAEHLFAESGCILNLASKEYSQCVFKYLPKSVRWITCVFGEEKDGKVVEKGTMCKMARGDMVRYLAENRVEDAEDVKAFHGLNYRYSPEQSDESTFVFLLKKNPGEGCF
ncbi:MAG: peroxide stress protein YaaA [Ruminiclostridium sp.]|nr:peroxide stress protein YaaA [Ruminiclostridium sp.]